MKLKTGGAWLKDFGQGTTPDEVQAYPYTDDEAHVMQNLWPDYYSADRVQSGLYSSRPPAYPAGPGCIWVRYKNTWLAVEKQHAFLATRRALSTRNEEKETA